jgi:Tfp pilus assembly protein PilN
MIEINLLPAKVKKAKKMQVFYLAGIFAGFLVLAFFVGIIVVKNSQIKEIDRKIKSIDAESATLQDKITEVKKFNLMEDSLKSKRKITVSLLEEQAVWIRLLDMIAENIYPDMWLTDVAHDRVKETGIIIRISGLSSSRAVFADFLRRLEEEENVSSLGITRIGLTDKYGAGWIMFEFNFLYNTVKGTKG